MLENGSFLKGLVHRFDNLHKISLLSKDKTHQHMEYIIRDNARKR